MESSRERRSRLSTSAATTTNNLSSSKPRHTREDEEGEVELKETVRDRVSKRRKKRRSGGGDDDGETTEVSVVEEGDDDNDTDYYDHKSFIGVPVPRKARSGSRRTLPESAATASSSSSSSSSSVKRKNSKKTTESSSGSGLASVNEDIEVEIAEVLFGLTNQCHNSKEERNVEKDTDARVCHPGSGLVQWDATGTTSDPSLVVGSKKLEMEADSTQVQSGSIAALEEESEQRSVRREGLSPEPVVIEESRVLTKGIPVVIDKEHNNNTGSRTDADSQDSTLTKATSATNVMEVKSQREEKFVIDLMAPAPMESSPDQDSFCDLSLDVKASVQDVEMKLENMVRCEEENMESLLKNETVVIEIQDKETKKIEKELEEKLDSEKPILDGVFENMSKLQEKQQSNVITLKTEPIAQSNQMPLPIPMSGWPTGLPPLGYASPFQTAVPADTARSSIALQPPPFVLSKHRPKRCATHHYIASNICLHQQVMKMNHFWPAVAGSAVLSGAATKPKNLDSSPLVGKMMVGSPFHVVNLNASQNNGPTVVNFPVLCGKGKIPEATHTIEPAQKRQAIVKQSPVAATVNDPSNGRPAFFFPLGQHQAPMTPATNHTGSSVSADSASVLGDVLTRITTHNKPLPAAAPTLSYSYPNNVYPFAISATAGNPPATKSMTPAQAMPFSSGSFYTSQVLQPSDIQQNASSSLVNGSSSSQKPPQTQQAWGPRLAQQLPKQQVPRHQDKKHNSNSSDKKEQLQSQEKILIGGPEMIPAQTFAVSFGSFNSLNFTSSAEQNHMILQRLPEMTQHGYQLLSNPQVAVQTGNEKKTGIDYPKKPALKSPASTVQTLVFDNSVRTLNFASSSYPGNWPSSSMSPTTQQLVQLQQQQQQQILHHQERPPTAGRSKAATTDRLLISSGDAKFPNSQGPLINVLQRGRPLQSHNQISFGGNSKNPL